MDYQIQRGRKWENFDSQTNSEIALASQQGRALILIEDQRTGERLVVVRLRFTIHA